MDRRDFIHTTAQSLLIYSFYDLLHLSSAWAKPIKPIIKKWTKEIEELAASVQSGKLKPQAWQDTIERLHSKIPLADVLRFTDFDKVVKRVRFPNEKIALVEDVGWPEVEGFPKHHRFGRKIFIYRKGTMTPPHAHNHLVSAHLIIKGDIRTRTFDRIRDLEKSILIKPTRDKLESAGSTVTMSDYHDNVHWFEGNTEISASFDLPIFNIEPEKLYKQPAERYNQIHLDVSAKPRPDGMIEARIIPFSESLRHLNLS